MTSRFPCLMALLFGLLCSNPLWAQDNDNYGLLFQAYNAPQEQRTSLKIGQASPLSLGNDFNLSFDLNFVQDKIVYFGYVFRLVNQSGQRISLLYDQKNIVFRLTVDGKYASIAFPKSGDWLYQNWNHFEFIFSHDSVSCILNNRQLGSTSLKLADSNFILVFGAGKDRQFYATDVPPMKIKNVAISESGKAVYRWSLKSGENNLTKDELQGNLASTDNPIWLLNLHSHWALLHKRLYNSFASVTFDPLEEQINILAGDSLYKVSVQADNELTWKNSRSQDLKLFKGNHLIFNSTNRKLYNYYTDSHSIAELDPVTGHWSATFDNIRPTEFNQSNSIFSTEENALYIIGGYGQMRYKNTVQRYSFLTNRWDTLQVKGDFFTPRYLAAAAKSGDSIYVIGGYGSKTGDQLLDPGYLYDCLVYNIKTQKFTKKFILHPPESETILGGAMLIDTAEGAYYVFGFSNERYDSQLQLFKGNLAGPQLTAVGNKIPFLFNDVKSEVRLFWSKKAQKLLAVTSIMDEQKGTTIAIYSISFPPNTLIDDSVFGSNSLHPIISLPKWLLGLIAAGLAILSGLFVFYFRRRQRLKPPVAAGPVGRNSQDQPGATNEAIHTVPEMTPVLPEKEVADQGNKADHYDPYPEKKNRLSTLELPELDTPGDLLLEEERIQNGAQIHLFGNFELIDKQGNRLAAQLSPLLKELFLVILLNSIIQQSGVSSKKLNELFWRNKSDKDANNNRSVNIAKLKNVLEKLESLSIVNDHGKWFVQYNPESVHIDLMEFQGLVNIKEHPDRKTVRKILSCLKKGSLLKHTEYDWLDDFKTKVSNLVIDSLINIARYLDPIKDTELYLEIANCLFSFDPINEQALKIKCKALAAIGRHSLAQSTYQHYCKEYQKMYGESFESSFSDIVSG